MRPLTTLALFLTSVVLGVVIWWSDRQMAESEADRGAGIEAGTVLKRFKPDAMGRLVVKRPNGEVTLEKRDGYWFIVSPTEDRADPEIMDSLLDLLSHLTVLDEIPIDDVGSEDDLEPEALGLTGEQVIRVELFAAPEEDEEFSGDADHVLLIGNPTPLANSLYARIPDNEDQPDVYIVDGNPRKYLEDPVVALRDRHLFLAPPEEIVEITVKTPRGDIEIKRKVTPPRVEWTLTQPLNTRADLERVDELLASLASLRVEEVVESGTLPGPPPNPIPDGSVALQLRRYGVEDPLVIYLRPARRDGNASSAEAEASEPLIEAMVSDRPAVFQVRSELLEDLPSSPNAFRDPHLAAIPFPSVIAIGIVSHANPPVILKRSSQGADGVEWFSERNGAEEAANRAQINELIDAINQTEVIDFVSEADAQLSDYNLTNPAVRVAISHYERQPDTAPDGAPGGSAGQFGIAKKVLQLGYRETEVNGVQAHRLFANFEGEPFVYELNPGFAENVPTHPLKWKDLRILSFNPISLKKIVRRRASEGTEIALDYDYRRDHWDATLDGEDRSEEVNRDSVRKMRDTLGSLVAKRWLTPSPQAFQALENPDAVFEVTIEKVDRATGDAKPETHVLRFAKANEVTAPGLDNLENYYGRLDDSPDIFQIDRKTYRDLIIQPLGTLVTTPE